MGMQRQNGRRSNFTAVPWALNSRRNSAVAQESGGLAGLELQCNGIPHRLDALDSATISRHATPTRELRGRCEALTPLKAMIDPPPCPMGVQCLFPPPPEQVKAKPQNHDLQRRSRAQPKLAGTCDAI